MYVYTHIWQQACLPETSNHKHTCTDGVFQTKEESTQRAVKPFHLGGMCCLEAEATNDKYKPQRKSPQRILSSQGDNIKQIVYPTYTAYIS